MPDSPQLNPAIVQQEYVKTVHCSVGDIASIKLAEFGEALGFEDVTDTIAKGCSKDTCIIDMTKLPDFTEKTLRVEWACTCGSGYKPGKNGTTNVCDPCPIGTYRKAGMPDCQECFEGSFSNQIGQVIARLYLHTTKEQPSLSSHTLIIHVCLMLS